MWQWLLDMLKASLLRGAATLGRGASVKTAYYEISAPTTQGVVKIMEALHDMPPCSALHRLPKHDSLASTVQAEEPMTVKG